MMTTNTATLRTVGDVTACIRKMQAAEGVEAWPGKSLADFARGHSGPRTRGSTTEAGLEAVPASRELVEFVPPNPQEGSRYYRFSAPELGGRLGAVALGCEAIRCPDRDTTHEVVLVDGPHGPELRLIVRGWDDEIVPFAVMYGDLPKVDDITVITSDHPGFGLVVSTWHPGDPLGSVKGFEEKPFDEIPSHTAVKLVWDDALEGRVIATFKG